ncbi:hypothetical protein GGR53DRAFT_384682 [Hypoxylon sp. FL1150]|nr:hypothetical protein GGR53DRAFT_384682 [Hypoxylon sp. FL1150]
MVRGLRQRAEVFRFRAVCPCLFSVWVDVAPSRRLIASISLPLWGRRYWRSPLALRIVSSSREMFRMVEGALFERAVLRPTLSFGSLLGGTLAFKAFLAMLDEQLAQAVSEIVGAPDLSTFRSGAPDLPAVRSGAPDLPAVRSGAPSFWGPPKLRPRLMRKCMCCHSPANLSLRRNRLAWSARGESVLALIAVL